MNLKEINIQTAEKFLDFFKNKYDSFKISSLTFSVEYTFNYDEDEIVKNVDLEEIIHIHCSSSFDDSDDFSMDFRSFSGKTFEECFDKFKIYFDGIYKIYLLEKNNLDDE